MFNEDEIKVMYPLLVEEIHAQTVDCNSQSDRNRLTVLINLFQKFNVD